MKFATAKIVLADFLLQYCAFWLSAALICNFRFENAEFHLLLRVGAWYWVAALGSIAFLASQKVYRKLWQYASVREVYPLLGGAFASVALTGAVGGLGGIPIPPGFYPVSLIFSGIALVLPRLNYRNSEAYPRKVRKGRSPSRTALMIGGGAAARKLLAEMETLGALNAEVVAIIDDAPEKHGKYLNHIPIVGGRAAIESAVREYGVDLIIFAIPSASSEVRRELLECCNRTNCKLLTIPSVQELLDGKVSVGQIKDVEIGDLLAREEIALDKTGTQEFLRGRRILVSGGGGSIGSELCRQISAMEPEALTIVDIYENNAYEIGIELKHRFPELKLNLLIGSLRDPDRLEEIFSATRPQVVFHAGAHKHVPLMEDSPKEAIKNNVFGTYHLACAARRHGVERFILISTDKAVNPTNVMGASKRMCEMVIQALNGENGTVFAAVRFGNVLGSNGSVIPLFKRQIAAREDLTLTHPEITRYFMTIPEAASLVLEAGAMARGGEIFILDMGKPVKILDLAKNLIRLSGLEPDTDIKIRYIGLRPGEKLYEELSLAEEGMSQTRNQKIFISNPVPFDRKRLLEEYLPHFREIIKNGGNQEIRDYLQVAVPTYRPVHS